MLADNHNVHGMYENQLPEMPDWILSRQCYHMLQLYSLHASMYSLYIGYSVPVLCCWVLQDSELRCRVL